MTITRVPQQPQALQTPQQLRDLTLIVNIRLLTDQPVAPTRITRRGLQDPRRAIRQPHRHLPQRITTHTTPHRYRHDTRPWRDRYCASALPPRGRRTQIRQHDHAHQLVQQTLELVPVTLEQTLVNDRQDRTSQTLRGQRRRLRRTHTLPTTLIKQPRHPRQDLLTRLQHPLRTTRTLHHTHPRQHRLTIQKRQHHTQPHTHTPTPRTHTNTLALKLRNDTLHRVVHDRQQTLLTTSEQVIERTPRHPRTRSDMRHRRPRITQLIKRHDGRAEQPRALHLRDPHSRIRHARTRRTRRMRALGDHATPALGRQTPSCAWRGSFEQEAKRGEPRLARRPEHRLDGAVRREVLLGQERERERERCISSAEASTYGAEMARGDPWHVCPQLTHAKTTPHHAI